jgi:DNA polymerase III gamma/tau subunit
MAQLRPATAFRIAGKIYATVQSSAAAKALEDQRETMRFHLDILTKLYRDVLVLSARADDVPLFNADQRPRLEEMARRMGWRAAAESAGLLLAARADIDRNANIRLALENALMGVAQRQPPLRD